MNEFFEYLKENGFEGTYCDFEDSALANREDIVDCLQVGGRPAERDKRGCE